MSLFVAQAAVLGGWDAAESNGGDCFGKDALATT